MTTLTLSFRVSQTLQKLFIEEQQFFLNTLHYANNLFLLFILNVVVYHSHCYGQLKVLLPAWLFSIHYDVKTSIGAYSLGAEYQ